MGSVKTERSTLKEGQATGVVLSARTTRKRTTRGVKRSNTTPVVHPHYSEMIIEAMDEITHGIKCSQYVIKKFIKEKYMNNLPSDFNKRLWEELNKLAVGGVLVRTNMSFKFAEGFNKAVQKSHEKSKAIHTDMHTKPSTQPTGTTTAHTEIADAESVQVQEKTKHIKGVGSRTRYKESGNNVFNFSGRVVNTHFH